MTETSVLPLPPSDDLAVLERQMQSALECLEEGGDDVRGPGSYRSYLRHAHVLAWRGVAHRQPGAPREVLDHLQFAQAFVDAFRPQPADPREEAALAFSFVLDSLYLADGALEESRVESRLANRNLSATEREVLRVLLTQKDRYLRRGEIQKLMSLARRPTPARISQILTGLDHEDLLVRMQGRAQGNPEASFYALSPRGFKICRDLGLDRRRVPYFRLEEGSWKEHLTPERIAVREGEALEPGRVAAVWSYRGGVGRTTAVAQAAPRLAERMHKLQAGRLLVIDFDLEAPGLDAHFAPGGLGDCRGLRGLIVDFYQLPPAERPKWLREALLAPAYVLQPSPGEHPSLYYLPSGFGPAALPGLDEERAEAWDRLQSEAKGRLGEAAEGETGPEFLAELRTALREDLYARTLVDPGAGFGLTAWAAVLELADELVVCACGSDCDPRLVRAVLGNFVGRQLEMTRGATSRVGFLFTEVRAGTEGDLDRWIEREVLGAGEAENARTYRTVAISEREAVDWLRFLEGAFWERHERRDNRAAIKLLIDRALDPGNSRHDRGISAGYLANAPNPTRKLALKILMEIGFRNEDEERQSYLEEAIYVMVSRPKFHDWSQARSKPKESSLQRLGVP